ncbi:MAG: hypothetical protein ABJA93_04745 [Sporichthyaceae bacterium]
MRTSIGTGVILMAIGGVLAFAVRAPSEVQQYLDVVDLGLILIWAGLLVLGMQIYMHRPRRPRPARVTRRDGPLEDPWRDQDVHRPGYAGETQRFPSIRGPRNR